MNLEDALKIINELMKQENLGQHIKIGKVCGSIRRNQPYVNDIDMVVIPNDLSHYSFGQEDFDSTIKRLDQGTIDKPMLGDKIKRFFYKGVSIDLYIANEETYETLVLIRTGSKEHNIKLTTLAKYKNMKLFASGTGLCKIDGDKIISIVQNTEDGILQFLLGKIPKPEERN